MQASVIASMGPRRWGRGRPPALASAIAVSASRFNGATTLGSWKTEADRLKLENADLLQWGHDAGVVEDSSSG